MRVVLSLALVGASCAGCMVGSSAADSDPEVDAAMIDRVSVYRSSTKINTRPFASLVGSFEVNCFASGDLADYRRIHPEQPGSRVTVLPGTVIVREVLDERQQPAKLTVMAKGPPGFDPSLGDWWFGVTDAHGVPLEDHGAPMIGRLEQCHECHRERTRDDFLFGVPVAVE